MTRLILFDIDGTLLKDAAGHRDAFSHAFKEIFGVETNIDIISPSGMTDQQIIIEVMRKHNLTEKDIIPKISDCMKSMVKFYEKIKEKSNLIILDGVLDLLKELDEKSYLLGLVTGNLEPIARAKLKSVGLNHYFKLGGFGSDDINRTKLVKLAIKRAQKNFNFEYNNNVILFGDTPHDMNAGHKAGLITIGVTTGIFSKEELEKAGANYVVDSLKDTNKIMNIILKKTS